MALSEGGGLTYYNNEVVIGQVHCRLVPPSAMYPDCVCVIRMTEQRLVVLEDNFDGTFVTHFDIPLGKVQAIEKIVKVLAPSNDFAYTPVRGGLARLWDLARRRHPISLDAPQSELNDGKILGYFYRVVYWSDKGDLAQVYFIDWRERFEPLQKALQTCTHRNMHT